MYLMECLPYVVVLNLGMANSLFLSKYLESVICKKSTIYFGQIWCFVLYIRTAISCNRLLITQASVDKCNLIHKEDQYGRGLNFICLLLNRQTRKGYNGLQDK